jgi:hypothetical protein
MGFDYDARAVIGAAVPAARLFETARARCCQHPEPAGKFCPECGKPAWKDERRPVAAYQVDDETGEWSLAGLPVVRSGLDDASVYVGAATELATSWNGDVSKVLPLSESVEAIRARVRGALEPLGLWDEGRFGLWALLGGG